MFNTGNFFFLKVFCLFVCFNSKLVEPAGSEGISAKSDYVCVPIMPLLEPPTSPGEKQRFTGSEFVCSDSVNRFLSCRNVNAGRSTEDACQSAREGGASKAHPAYPSSPLVRKRRHESFSLSGIRFLQGENESSPSAHGAKDPVASLSWMSLPRLGIQG